MSDQQEQTFYDDGAFYVEETRYKVWHSFDKDKKPLVTSLTKEQCINATRFYLKRIQDGCDDSTSVKHEGVVSGKL